MSSITKFNQDNTFQRIRAHHFEPEKYPLEGKELEIFQRVKHLYMLRMDGKYSQAKAVKKLQKDFDISAAQAYRDNQFMHQIYGDPDRVDMQAEKLFIRENFYDLYLKMYALGNFEGAMKALEKYEKTFPEMDPNEADPEKLQAQSFNISMAREMQKALKEMILGKGSINFNDMDVTDVEYKEVKDGEENS